MKRIYQLTRSTFALVAVVASIFAFTTKANAQFLCGAGFSYTVSPGGVVTFYDSSYVSSGNITTATWSFGDGSSGSGTQVTHTYNGTGPYFVCYTIVTSTGCSDSTCQYVYLTPCTITGTFAYDSLMSTLTVTASGGTPPYSYVWNNGSTTTTITVNTPGQYCVNIIDANQCSQYLCYTVGGGGGTCSAYYYYYQSPSGGPVNFYGSFTGTYASVLWNFGDGTTSTQLNPVHTYANPGVYGVCVTTYTALGTVCATYCDTVIVNGAGGGSSVLCGNVFGDLNQNGVLDSSENGLSGQTVMLYGNGMQQTFTTTAGGNYTFNVQPGTYYIYYCTQFPNSLTVPNDSGGCGFYTVTIGANDTICGFDFGVAANSVIISGTIFIDANTNGIMDAGEYGIPYQPVQIGVSWAYSNANGQFSIYKPTGTYSVSYTPSGNYAPYALTTPSSITVNATTAGSTYGNNNFGLNIPPGTQNLSVSIDPHTTITPGFPAWYDLEVCNIGVTPVAATLVMNYDGGLTLDWASPAAASNNTVTHTLTWNLGVINPGDCEYIWVDFDASTGYVLGTNVIQSAMVTPVTGSDIDMSNNIDTVHQTVVGSWDPNNKLAVQTNYTDPAYQVVSTINPDQSIEYTINFQNLGTAPAQNIVVVDELSNDVDWSTYEYSGSSHNAKVNRNGNVVTYQFLNIQLPDATTNEPQSHGYVTYRIKAINGLAAGHQISDFANIYFDFNSPVTTNNAVITLIQPSGINDNAASVTVGAYPNPVSTIAALQFNLKSASNVVIDVINSTGSVQSQLVNAHLSSGVQKVDFNASELANGIYTIRLTVNGQSSYTKVSVSH